MMRPGAREALQEALTRADDDPEGALELMDQAIQRAVSEGDVEAHVTIARHAGIVAAHAGSLPRARGYCEAACQIDPDDGYSWFALGDVHRRINDRIAAKGAFVAALRVARRENDTDLEQMTVAALSLL